MKQIIEKARQIPILADVDVLVVGSGPAGLAAAISAAREGVSTMLVDRYGCFGGVITQVGVESIAWYRHEGTTDVEGIGIEFERRAMEMAATHKEPQSLSEALDSEMFKYVADKMVKEANIMPLLHCLAVDTVMEDDTIRGIITESKSGRCAILGKRIIDATGDGDVAYHAGAPYRKIPKEELMGVTVMFSCVGVDKKRFIEYCRSNPTSYKDWAGNWKISISNEDQDLFSPYIQEPFNQARKDGIIPEGISSLGGTWSSITDEGEATGLNMIYMQGYDPTDVWDLTKAEIEGRYQAMLAIEVLRNYVPGFANAKLRNFGMTLGTRDSRKIICNYQLTGYDVRNQARFDDSIGIFPEFLDGYGLLTLPTTARYFQIPYRILLPQSIENLLVAGRCVSGDKVSHAAMRSMMACTVTGQGAGVAAAVSIKDDVSVKDIDTSSLREALRRQGVRLN